MLLVLLIRAIFISIFAVILLWLAIDILTSIMPEFRGWINKMTSRYLDEEVDVSNYEKEAKESEELAERIRKLDREKVKEDKKTITTFKKETK